MIGNTDISRNSFANASGKQSSFFSRILGSLRFGVTAVSLTIVGSGVSAAGAQTATVPSLIVGQVDDSQRIVLHGNTHPLARPEFDRGAAPEGLPMDRMLLLLQRSAEQNAELEALLSEQQDTHSANYHQWLTPEEFGERFGVSDRDVQQVEGWLSGHGFAVNSISSARNVIEFSGNVSQVREAFHTEIHKYQVADKEHWANASDPEIPAALAPVISGLVALNDFGFKAMHKTFGPVVKHAGSAQVTPEFSFAYGGNEFYGVSPYDFATQYNILPLWNAGVTGAGQSIAIVGQTEIKLADVAAFRKAFGLPVLAPEIIVNGTSPGTIADDEEEADLDVEWSGAVAKGATIKFVTSATTASSSGVMLSAQYIVDKKVANILSMSYGACEEMLGTTENAFFNALWQQAAGEGITVFVAAGDSGSAGCDAHGQPAPVAAEYGLQVNGVASTPYNVAVGGTDLNDRNVTAGTNTYSTYWSTTNNATTGVSLKKYVPETVWNDSCTILNEAACNNSGNTSFVVVDGGSGGKSGCTTFDTSTHVCSGGYAKPSWQKGTGVPADGKRDIPDVSLFAGDGLRGSFFLICDSDASQDGTCNYANSNDVVTLAVGGTSGSSPAMAGIQALINQKVNAAQGNVNPTLYALAARETLSGCNSTSGSGSSCVFNDVTNGTNSMPCYMGTANCTATTLGDSYGVLPGYTSSTGYDLASGWGSVNATNLVNSWPGAATAPKVTLSATTAAFGSEVAGTTSAAKTVTVTNTGTATLTGVAISLAGENPTDFVETNNCGTSLAVKAVCTITIEFKPAAAAAYSASISVKDNAAGSPQVIALTGAGIAGTPKATLSVTSIAFGTEAKGIASVAKTVTLTNTGTAELTSVAVSLAGLNPTDFVLTNHCPTSLAVKAACTISVGFKPVAAAAYSGTVSIKDNASGSPQVVALTGTGFTPAPKVTLGETSVSFGTLAEATTSAAKTVTLTNTGTAALAGVVISISGTNPTDFIESNNCAASIAVNGVCTITLKFKPAAASSYKATVSIKDSASGSPQTIAITGTGVVPVPKATLSATSEAFGSETIGLTTAAKLITVTNTGTGALTGVAVSLAGTNPADFIESNNCAASIAINGVCTITLKFKPAAAAAYKATVSIKDNASGSPQAIALTGTGIAPVPKATLSATTEAFASEAVGTMSAAKTVTLTNTGTGALSGVAVSLGGTNPTDFVETNNCPASIAINAECTIDLKFKPVAGVAYKATVSIKDNASGSPQTIALTGTGFIPVPKVTLSATAEAFGSEAVGTTSAAKTVTLTNTGTGALTGLSIALAGTNAADFVQTHTCEATIEVGGTCTISLAFKPAAAAIYAATISIKDNATGSPQSIALTGTGFVAVPKVTLSATSLAFGNQTVTTTSAAKTVTLTNSGTESLTGVAITLAGTNPADFIETHNCTATIAVKGTCTITLQFKPAAVAPYSAIVSIKDNASPSPQTIALTGSGIASSLTDTIVLYAGTFQQSGYTGNGGAANKAKFYYAEGTAEDASGNLYIADEGNNVIRKVNATTGIITTVAGNGYGAGMVPGGYTGDGGPALKAELGGPFGVALDKAGNLYIADTYNSAIRKVTASTGVITTVAGNGTSGYSGDGGKATSAELFWPKAIAIDTAGNLYISDASNGVIRKVTASTGIITTIAGGGNGCAAETDPYGDGCPAKDSTFEVSALTITGTGGISVDSKGNVYIADPDTELVREIVASTGIIKVVAGNGYINSQGQGGYSGDGGGATGAELNLPRDVKVDGAGNLFIADADNNVIRKVALSTGKISTVAGVYHASGGGKMDIPVAMTSPTAVTFNTPAYLSIDPAGNLFITDVNDFVVEKVYGIATPLPVN